MTVLARFAKLISRVAPGLLLLGTALLPAVAYGGYSKPLRGEMEWRYADYSSKASNGEKVEASHFVQQYSLMYNYAGNIYNSRAGQYNVGLGFEWWSLDAEFGDEDFSQSHFKPLYQGELLLAPAGLPFRLHLFAYDRELASFSESYYQGGVIEPRILTDVYNGTHQVIGGTLVAGIRNGSYLGEYRDVLASMPRLFIDFRQTTVEDNESRTPEHYRARELAFVSLNKKDNWFHYRLYEYKDYIDASENYTEKTFMLGTIDQMLYRQWISLTNWLRLSTDGSLVITKSDDNSGEVQDNLYDFNLFFEGKTRSLQFSNMNSFYRSTDGSRVESQLTVPLMLTYFIDQDRQFRGQLVLDRNEFTNKDFSANNSYTDDLYFSGILETGHTKQVRIDPGLELEYKDGNLGRGLSARGRVEAFTNPRYPSDRAWLLSYSLADFHGTSTNDQKVNFVEQEAVVSASRSFSPYLRAGGTQTLVFGTGELDTSVSQSLVPVSDTGLFGTLSNNDTIDGQVLHATTELFVDYSRPRLTNRFEAIFDFLKVSQEDAVNSLLLRHRLRYQKAAVNYTMTNRLRFGDGGDLEGISSDRVQTGYNRSASDMFFEHHSLAEYSPSRNWSVRGTVDYQWSGGGSNDTSVLLAREEARYTFFRSNGILRRWLEFDQAVSYEQSWEDVGEGRQYGEFSLGCAYYPTHNTFLRGDIGYELYDPGATTLTYGLGVGVNFPLFKVEANYRYGFSEDEDGYEVKDHRWELNVKKLI